MLDFTSRNVYLSLAGALAAVFLVLAATSSTILPASMAASSNETNVSLSVATETSVTISPNEYDFSDMNLGETNFSDMAQLELVIENDGSTNITDIYAHVNTIVAEQSNPLGSAVPGSYAASGFLFIKNDTSGMYHAGRLEWNVTEAAGGPISGVTDADSEAKAHGFYRNASAGKYLWSLGSNASGGASFPCNSTAGQPIELVVKNETDTGSNRDLTTNSATIELNTVGGQDNAWAASRADQFGPLHDHYVAAHATCEKFFIYRFDRSGSTFLPSIGDNAQFLVGPSGTEEIAPGETFTGRVGAAVPSGVPAGTTNQSALTVYASSGG